MTPALLHELVGRWPTNELGEPASRGTLGAQARREVRPILRAITFALPEGAARGVLQDVVHRADDTRRIEWFAGELVFARLVLDHEWDVSDARAVFEMVRAL